jgi:hypothetical protein
MFRGSLAYESRSQRLLPRPLFMQRLLLHAAVCVLLVLVSLAIGMGGFAYFEGLAWRDGFLNSAMLLGGMGPVDAPKTNGGKLFEGCYALYAGLVFIVTVGVAFAPLLHRMLHKFHWSEDKK